MTSELDDLCVLPAVGPENEGILRDEGYKSYETIAQSTPFDLHQDCDIGLSDTPGIINTALELIDCPCPKCNSEEVSPIWGGYPGGKLSEEERDENDLFCADCGWLGEFVEAAS